MPKETERPTVELESSEEESSEDSDHEHETPTGTDESLPEVTTKLRGLNLDMSGKNPTPSGSQVGGPRSSLPGDGGSGPKVNAPQEFTGARNQFDAFQMQCMIVFKMTDKYETAEKKVMFITSYLRGGAYEWIQPHLRDYLTNDEAERKPATNRMFAGANALFREMEQTFKHGSEELEAERDVQRIYQKGSAARYRAEFQILAAKTSWNDEALAAQFYRGLKDVVKDEIARGERPTTTEDMYTLAIKIDERLYERLLEKKGKFVPRGANTKAKRDLPEWRNDYFGPQKMQLDATQGKPGSKGQKKGQKKSKDKSQVECYGCGKKGHYKNECKARKQSHELQDTSKPRTFKATQGKGMEPETPTAATLAATTQDWTFEDAQDGRGAYNKQSDMDTDEGHGLKSWTACYDDSCSIHYSDKMGSGYFPSRRRQSICLTRGMPDHAQTAQDALTQFPTEEIEDWDLLETVATDSEGEEDSDKEVEPFNVEFLRGDLVPQLLHKIVAHRQAVFPWKDGQQWVNDTGFTNLMFDLRQMLQGVSVVEGSVNYHMIVREWVPLGSDFTARGGYSTPDGVVIPHTLRQKVREAKKEYADQAEQQRSRQLARVQALAPRSPREEREDSRQLAQPKTDAGATRATPLGKLEDPPEEASWQDLPRPQRIAAGQARYADNLRVWVTISTTRAIALIDSGCTGIFMTPGFARRSKILLRKKAEPFSLSAFDGKPVAYNQGMITQETEPVPLRMGRHREKLQFDITDSPGFDVVLGLPWLKGSNPTINWGKSTVQFEGLESMPLPVVHDALDKIDIRAMSATELQEQVEKNPDQVQVLYCKKTEEAQTEFVIPPEYADFRQLFEKESDEEALPKHQPWDHEIRIQEGKQPKKEPLRPVTAQRAEQIRGYVDEGLRKGHIRESDSPAGYPLHIVVKPGKKDWVCVDYRGLNEITVKNSYPLPLIHELQDRLQGAKWFTAFDIPGAYNRIRIKEGEEWKTAFRTRFGLFEYLVMPFGLTNAPATFQAYINNVLRKYLDVFVVVYLDDILVYSKTYEDHVQHVRKVLQALKDADMRIKPEKTEFHKSEIKFLGYVVSREGLKMDKGKIEAVTSWPKPTTVKEVQSFLGFANFYRQFIQDYSRITTPLTQMTKKDQGYEWTAEAEAAFQELKTRFSTGPILVIYDPTKSVTVETDASDYAIGACLSQPDEKGKLRPVAYLSRKMTPAELNYEIHDKELLAIVEAFRHWRIYLEGHPEEITVITDHKNLTKYTTTKELTPRQIRWYQDLATFKMRIHYRKGSENARADAMSRRKDYVKGNKPQAFQLLAQNADGTLQINRIAATAAMDANSVYDEMKAEQEREEFLMQVRAYPEEYPAFSQNGSTGLWEFEGRIYVPTTLRKPLLTAWHDGPVLGHPGTAKMLELLKKAYYFPKMRNAIEEYVPKRPWESVAMDFIVKLPASADPVTKESYDSILVIVDRFTKFGRFIPFRETWGAEKLAHIFIKNVIANHGTPQTLITDRDKLFTSNFWKALSQELGIKQKLSTAYHPQTDGQTERLNQTLEQYLRCYVNDRQDNWIALLPLAQIAYNQTPTTTTGTSPFYANYGFDPPELAGTMEVLAGNPAAAFTAQQMATLHENLRLDLMFVRQRMTVQANKKRIEGPTLKEGDRVYLLRRNIKSKKQSKKLDAVKLGPFKIRRKKGPVSFELEIPKKMRIHPVFHISLLEPATPDTTLQDEVEDLDPEIQEPSYEVERILKERTVRGQQQYLVKWTGQLRISTGTRRCGIEQTRDGLVNKVEGRPDSGRNTDSSVGGGTVVGDLEFARGLHLVGQTLSFLLRTILRLAKNLLVTHKAGEDFREFFLVLVDFALVLFTSTVQGFPGQVDTRATKSHAFGTSEARSVLHGDAARRRRFFVEEEAIVCLTTTKGGSTAAYEAYRGAMRTSLAGRGASVTDREALLPGLAAVGQRAMQLTHVRVSSHFT
ncbi:hypothetical protein Q7P37_011640 [Cladosporium fusiforme]